MKDFIRDPVKNILQRYPYILHLLRKIYPRIPMSRSRLSEDFWLWYLLYQEMESWDIVKMKQYQMDLLRGLLKFQQANNLYYGKILRDVNVDKIDTVEDFTKVVPAISRKEFSDKYASLRVDSFRHNGIYKESTSGTTGNALQFYHHISDHAREWASICHQWKRVGYDPVRSKRAEFRGLTWRNQLVQKIPDDNMIRCSILQINPESVPYFAAQIIENGIDYYHGYPSAIYLLAKNIERAKISFPQPKGILLASEQVYDWQLSAIKETFPESLIFAHYGCTEKTVLAGWCERSEMYHVLPQYSLVEVDKTSGEIVGTNLHNMVNPFIRYRMTDAAIEYDEEICSYCHRPYFPLIKIGGRTEDFLYSPERGWIPPAIVTYPLKKLRSVLEIRFVQTVANEIVIEYTKRNPSDSLAADIKAINSGLKQILGEDIKLSYQEVGGFEKDKSGKFKWIVSTLRKKDV